ncbi:hypothetical protein SM14BL09_12180 [Serratia marcescens]|nr:hypothetical protein SM14BL09_12180 [Serratia marcescens]
MKIFYEEKTFENYFNAEISQGDGIFFPFGQVQEGFIGADCAYYTSDLLRWGFLEHDLNREGVDLKNIAKKMDYFLKNDINSLPDIKTNILFQYKRPELITTSTGLEWKHWNKEYFRYDIYSKQHQLLKKINSSFGNEVAIFYVAPAIKGINELVLQATKRNLVNESNFKHIAQLDGHKRNTYVSSGTFSIGCSEPQRLDDINIRDFLNEYQKIDYPDNYSSIVSFASKIKTIMQGDHYFRLPFNTLIASSEEFSEIDGIYSLVCIQAFEKITGVKWALFFR